MSINYSEKIPNNVDLASDRRLQRALENWQPAYLEWWKDMGPEGAQTLTKLGISFSGVTSRATLRAGVAEAFLMLGRRVVRAAGGKP